MAHEQLMAMIDAGEIDARWALETALSWLDSQDIVELLTMHEEQAEQED